MGNYQRSVLAQAADPEQELLTMPDLLQRFPSFPVYLATHYPRLEPKYFTPFTFFKHFGKSYLFKTYQRLQTKILAEYADQMPLAVAFRGKTVPIALVLSNMTFAPAESRAVFLIQYRKVVYSLTAFDDFVDNLPSWSTD